LLSYLATGHFLHYCLAAINRLAALAAEPTPQAAFHIADAASMRWLFSLRRQQPFFFRQLKKIDYH